MDSAADNDLEVIRAQTKETRAQLASKLEALESQVTQTVAGVTSAVEAVQQTVSGATEAVGNVVEKVSDTVTGTVEGVKQSVADTVSLFDVRPAVQEHPWASVGVAFAAGLAGGYLIGGPSVGGVAGAVGAAVTGAASTVSNAGAAINNQGWSAHDQAAGFATAHRHAEPSRGGQEKSPTLNAMGDTLSELGGAARSLGISALMGLVTQLAKRAVPEAMQQDVTTALGKLKTRLGGRHDVDPEQLFKS